MKKLAGLVVILAVAGLCITAAAEEVDKTVILFRSMDDPNVDPDPAVCERAVYPFEPPEGSFFATIGASLWSSWVRIRNGEVIEEKVRQIGTGTMCSYITDLNFVPFDKESPAYFEGSLRLSRCEEIFVALSGEVEFTNNALLEGGPVFGSGYFKVLPDRSTEGIKWGQATTNSVATPFPIPGFETGSFWSLQLIWE